MRPEASSCTTSSLPRPMGVPSAITAARSSVMPGSRSFGIEARTARVRQTAHPSGYDEDQFARDRASTSDPADYDKIRVDDLVDLGGLSALAPGSSVRVALRHADGTADLIAASHTLSGEHIEWFKAGSALNVLASRRRS